MLGEVDTFAGTLDSDLTYRLDVIVVGDKKINGGPLKGVMQCMVIKRVFQHLYIGDDIPSPVPPFDNRVEEGNVLNGSVEGIDSHNISDIKHLGKGENQTANHVFNKWAGGHTPDDRRNTDKKRQK